MNGQKVQLSENAKQAIDQWLRKFPEDQKQSAVLYALHVVQDENQGWLSEPLMEAVADYLQMPKIQVFEVATFYDMYELEPVGRHKIGVCNSISCNLMGSEKIMEYLSAKLGVKAGETTRDGHFTLKEVACLGACKGGPMMYLDKTYHESLTPEKIDGILARAKD